MQCKYWNLILNIHNLFSTLGPYQLWTKVVSNIETFRLKQTTSFFHVIGFQTRYKIDGLPPKFVLQIVNYENSRVPNLMAAEQKLPVWNKFVLWRF